MTRIQALIDAFKRCMLIEQRMFKLIMRLEYGSTIASVTKMMRKLKSTQRLHFLLHRRPHGRPM